MRSGLVTQGEGTSLTGQGALSISQQRLWVLEQLHPRNPAQNVSCGLRLTGPLDTERFGSAWREVVEQYEILRTEFHAGEGVPQPVVVQSFSPQLIAVGLEGVSAEERGTRLSQLAREEARRAFDLSSGPLLRASLWRVAPLEYVFLLVAHRIVCDEASLGVLLREVALCYGTSQSGDAWAARQTPLPYSEFVSHQGKASEERISYWKQRLAGAPASLGLPTERNGPPQQTFFG